MTSKRTADPALTQLDGELDDVGPEFDEIDELMKSNGDGGYPRGFKPGGVPSGGSGRPRTGSRVAGDGVPLTRL